MYKMTHLRLDWRTDMTRLAFIRHGITDWNLQGRVQDLTDIPLNEAEKIVNHTLQNG